MLLTGLLQILGEKVAKLNVSKERRQLMTTRMTAKQWEALLPSDKEVLKALNILSLVKPLPGKSPASPRLLPKPYVLFRISTCSICETTFSTYFRMLPFPENPYALQAKKIAFKDVLPADTIRREKESCFGCFYCYEILAKETKRELIKRIIILTGRR